MHLLPAGDAKPNSLFLVNATQAVSYSGSTTQTDKRITNARRRLIVSPIGAIENFTFAFHSFSWV
jgi:hypothetical protein